MSITQAPHRSLRVLRFDRVQRTAHWANALLFFSLMFTAVPLYFGSFFGIVLPRHLIENDPPVEWARPTTATDHFAHRTVGSAMRHDVRPYQLLDS